MEKVVRLRVQLEGIEPGIWRRIVVPSSYTLTELHAVIQSAMGWEDSHLHMFEIEGKRCEIPYDGGLGPEPDSHDESGHKLKDVLSSGMEFSYLYDFGDDWTHRIIVEDQGDAEEGKQVPACIAGERACPPEDSGGPFGYPEFLDALSDPDHPEHEDIVDWAGEFDPAAFNIAQANNLIGAICAIYRERGMGFGG